MLCNIANNVDHLAQSNIALPPHSSSGLHHLPSSGSGFKWGHTVQHLWSTMMKHGVAEKKIQLWDELCSRMLLWRATVGPEVAKDGEWLRKEVIASLARESSIS